MQGINMYAQPGSLTALMGGSGAGKTTLMDCVLGRKTTGLIRCRRRGCGGGLSAVALGTAG